MVPEKFRKSPEALVNYNYTDFAEGTGVITFYGAESSLSGSYILSGQTVYSDEINTHSSAVGVDFEKNLDLDFDLTPFNFPKTVKGTAIINIPFYVKTSGGEARTYGYVLADVKHLTGSTETSLGTLSGSTILSPTVANSITSKVSLLKIPLTTKVFKRGDILRITIEGWSQVSAGGGAEVQGIYIEHDPKSRTDADSNTITQLSANIPFKIK